MPHCIKGWQLKKRGSMGGYVIPVPLGKALKDRNLYAQNARKNYRENMMKGEMVHQYQYISNMIVYHYTDPFNVEALANQYDVYVKKVKEYNDATNTRTEY